MPDYVADDFATIGRRLREIEAEGRGDVAVSASGVRCEDCGVPWRYLAGSPLVRCAVCGRGTPVYAPPSEEPTAPCA